MSWPDGPARIHRASGGSNQSLARCFANARRRIRRGLQRSGLCARTSSHRAPHAVGTKFVATDCSDNQPRNNHGKESKKEKIFQKCGKRREERNAPLQKRQSEKRPQGKRRQSQKQEAGHRHWIVEGSQEGKESPKEEKILTLLALTATA